MSKTTDGKAAKSYSMKKKPKKVGLNPHKSESQSALHFQRKQIVGIKPHGNGKRKNHHVEERNAS